MAMLELSDLNSYYGRSHILYDVSMSVDSGSLVTLIGRNGAGKSTTLNSIMGLVTPKSGSVTFRGEDVTGSEPHQTARRGISIIPETRRVFPHLSVGENLRLGHVGHDVDRPIESLLDEVFEYFPRLADRVDQQAGQMSGGEQQMLTIGRALMSDPDLLLIDEPTEGLMPTLVDELGDILVDINQDGTTMLLVEQNVELALTISQYAYVLEEGAITFEGESDAVRENQEVKDRYLSV